MNLADLPGVKDLPDEHLQSALILDWIGKTLEASTIIPMKITDAGWDFTRQQAELVAERPHGARFEVTVRRIDL